MNAGAARVPSPAALCRFAKERANRGHQSESRACNGSLTRDPRPEMGRAVMHAGVGGRLHRYSCCAGLEPCGTVSPMKPTVSHRISPRDLMARDHLDHYFRVGEGAINEIERLLDNEPERILDLPCGHGRLMRWLRAAYPYAEIVGCDLDPDAVNFCA